MKDNFIQEIRFAGYSEPWKQRKLKEIADFSKGSGYSKSDLTHKGDPIILYGRLYTKYETLIRSVDTFTVKKEKSVMSKGHEVIVPSSGETSEDISRAAVVKEPGIILGGDLNVIRPMKEIDSIFLALSISNGKQRKELIKRAQGKSVVHLHNSDLKEVDLLFPAREEQTKIGEFFTQLDETIALHQQELDTLKQAKQGFLQKMFPREEKNVPEFRFPGFTEEWVKHNAGDIIKSHSSKPYLVDEATGGEFPVIQQGNKSILGYFNGNPFINYKEVTLFGDHTVSLYKPQNPFFIATDGLKILSANNIEGDFLYAMLERYKPEAQGYKRHLSILKSSIISFPEDKREQLKVGIFFKQLDDYIKLQEDELNFLRQTKKAFLQKMFV